MTKITYIKSDDRRIVEISGHTGLINEQTDVGCAAVSMLVSLLVTTLRIENNCGHLEYLICKTDSGDVKIDLTPETEYRDRLFVMTDTVLLGFRILAEEYPDYVKFFDK